MREVSDDVCVTITFKCEYLSTTGWNAKKRVANIGEKVAGGAGSPIWRNEFLDTVSELRPIVGKGNRSLAHDVTWFLFES